MRCVYRRVKPISGSLHAAYGRPFSLCSTRLGAAAKTSSPEKTTGGYQFAVKDSTHPCFQALHILSWHILTSRDKVKIADLETNQKSILIPVHMECILTEYGSLREFLRRQVKFFVVDKSTVEDAKATVTHRIPLDALRSIIQSIQEQRLKGVVRSEYMRVTDLNASIQKDVRSLMTKLGFHRFIDFLKVYFPLLLTDEANPATASIITSIASNVVPIGVFNVRTPHLASLLILAGQRDRLPEYAFMAFQMQGGLGLKANKNTEVSLQPIDPERQRVMSLDAEHEKKRVYAQLPRALGLIYDLLPADGSAVDFDTHVKAQLPQEIQQIPMLARKLSSLNSPRIAFETRQSKYFIRRGQGPGLASATSQPSSLKMVLAEQLMKSHLMPRTHGTNYIKQMPARAIQTIMESIVPVLPADGSEVSLDDKLFADMAPSAEALVALGKRICSVGHPKIKIRYVGDKVFLQLRIATDIEGYNQRMALDAPFKNAGVYPDSAKLPEETRKAFDALRNALPANGSAVELTYAQELVREYADAWPANVGKKLANHPGVNVNFDTMRGKYMVSRVEMVHEIVKDDSKTSPTSAETAQDHAGLSLDIPEIFTNLWENVPKEWVRVSALEDCIKGHCIDLSNKKHFLRVALHLRSYFDFDIVSLDPKLYAPEDKREQYMRPFDIIIRRREVDPPEFYLAHKAQRKPDGAPLEIPPIKQFTHDIELILRLAFAIPGDFMPLPRALGQLPPRVLADLNNNDTPPEELITQYPYFFDVRVGGTGKRTTVPGEGTLVRSRLGPRKERAKLTDDARIEANIKRVLRLLVGVVADLGRAAGGCLIEDIPLALSKEEAREIPKNLEGFFLKHPDYFTVSDDSAMVSVPEDALLKLKGESDTAADVTFKMHDKKGFVKEVSNTVVSLYAMQPSEAITDDDVNFKTIEWMHANPKKVQELKRKMVKYKPLRRSAIAEFLYHISEVIPERKAERRALDKIRGLNSDVNKYNDELTLIKHIVDCLPTTGEAKVNTVIHKLMDSDAVQVLPPNLKDFFEYYADEISCRVDDAGMWLGRPKALQGAKDEYQKSMRNMEYDYKDNPYRSSDSLLNPMEYSFPIPPPSDEGSVLVFSMPPFSLIRDTDLEHQLPRRLKFIAMSTHLLKRHPTMLETQPSKKARWPHIVRHTDLEIPIDRSRKPVFKTVSLDVERRWVAQICRLLPPTGKVRSMDELRGRTHPDLRAFITDEKELPILKAYPDVIRVEISDSFKSEVDAPVKYKIRRNQRLVALAEGRRNWALVMYAINALNVKHVMHLEAKKDAAASDISITFADYIKEVPVTIKKAMNNDEIFDVISRCVYVTVGPPSEKDDGLKPEDRPSEKDTDYQKLQKQHLAKRLRLRYGLQRDTLSGELRKRWQSTQSGGISLDDFEFEEHGDVKKEALENTYNVIKVLCGNDLTATMSVDASAIGNVLPSNTNRIIRATYGGFLDFIRSFPSHFEIIKQRSNPPLYNVRVIRRPGEMKQ